MHPHRRRKKRANHSKEIRTVEIIRNSNEQSFGFTISGQVPCILSSIVPNSPADLAGLRSGDFLISVNGLNVSKYPHETVVQLIGNSTGKIKMTIAENYYSDSSDEDIMFQNQPRIRPKHPHNKNKFNRVPVRDNLDPRKFDLPESNRFLHSESHNVIHSPNATNNPDISNVSAMVRCSNVDLEGASSSVTNSQNMSLEYRVIVGYLGTIEMPKQIATSSKLQTVRSCIRKMRQEKRNPTVVLMKILPSCLNLFNSSNILLATYPSARLNYVSSSSDNNSKFFGIVTSAIYADGLPCDSLDALSVRKDIVISNSCHVFVIDTKLIDHNVHIQKADKFKICCTKDPISNSCLEFPNNSEYIVNLIRSMYSLKSPMKYDPTAMRRLNLDGRRRSEQRLDDPHELMLANSPQPSNHSEITTTSSNSDSGIGFHNDYANLTDRILVVDFPGLNQSRRLAMRSNNDALNFFQRSAPRPFGIINDVQLENISPIRNIRSMTNNGLNISHGKSKSADYNPIEDRANRLTVRAMPDPIVGPSKVNNQRNDYENVYPPLMNENWLAGKTVDPIGGDLVEERPIDVPESFEMPDLYNNYRSYRSCDDMMMIMDKEETHFPCKFQEKPGISIDDISMLSNKEKKDEHVFLMPVTRAPKKSHFGKKSLPNKMKNGIDAKTSENDKLLNYKLSPKVFGLSMSFENLSSKKKSASNKKSEKCKNEEELTIWGSLMELRHSDVLTDPQYNNVLEGTYSEPDLRGLDETKHITADASPFKRWGQSSLRSRLEDTRTPLQRRPSSLAASESDVYAKVNLNNNNEELCPKKMETKLPTGPTVWGQSFELLLNDPAGLHAFAEFLKKEFSAENIYFWTACERYRQINDIVHRTKEALAIFNKHLANGALEPVNVDSQARNTAQDGLQMADKDLFMVCQKQIFNLMKFDSYQRFIRSDLYKSCVEAEQKHLPLPYPAELLDPMLRINLQSSQTANTITKLKKSLSNAEDRRRKSLLPWHRKTRCKSKDRDETKECSTKNSTSSSNSNTLKITSNQSASDVHSSRSSLSSFDATISKIGSFDPDDSKCSLCRVILANGATTIVQTKINETIRELVERLLDKRGISYQSFEAFLVGNNKPLALDSISTQLAGKEIVIEQRVQFKLDLPNRKVISVKSKPCKVLSEVLRPILHKYNYRLELVQVFSKQDNSEMFDTSIPVTAIDGQRLQILCKANGEVDWQGEVTPIAAGGIKKLDQNFKIGGAPITFVRANKLPTNSNGGAPTVNTLDEITNKVFNELLQGKVEAQGMQNGMSSNTREGSVKSDDWGSEASSGIFGRIRRRDSSAPNSNRGDGKSKKNPNKSSAGGSEDGNDSNNGMKKPLIAKWKAGVKLQVTNRNQNDELLEGLKRAQRSRLEDQRGTEINFELPDFLKDKEKYQASNANKLRKTKFDETPSNSVSLYSSNSDQVSTTSLSPQRPPQPAPRLSIVGAKSPSKSESMGSVQAKINSLENSILMNCSSGSSKNLFMSPSRSPIDTLNLSTQCIPSNTPMRTRKPESPVYNQPIYYSPDGVGDSTMVLNHQQLMNSSFESYASENANEHHDYQEIDDSTRRDSTENGELRTTTPPPLPPKPRNLPIKPSNWGQNNKENLFKVPQELPRRVLNTNQTAEMKNDVYLDQPTSSFV